MLNMLKAVTIAGLSLLLIVSSSGVSIAQDEESFVREICHFQTRCSSAFQRYFQGLVK